MNIILGKVIFSPKHDHQTRGDQLELLAVLSRIVSILLVYSCLTSCSYLQHTFKQAGYENQFKNSSKKSVQKHLLTSETFFVYGEVFDKHNVSRNYPLAVAAMSKLDEGLELVDITHQVRKNSFYGLHLPSGEYQILTLADSNGDGLYTTSEIVAVFSLHLDNVTYPYGVAGDLNIVIDSSYSPVFQTSLQIPVQAPIIEKVQQSVFFPKGTIRKPDDPIFSETNAMLGMYSPADFMEQAPMMFYALEEDFIHKIPIVFVHGIGGTVTQFYPIIEKLDRQRYKPWFFFYPSGADLEKLSNLFYKIFLSGELVGIDNRTPLIVVAHSMGGVVVRKAINFYHDDPEENKIRLFVSIATPFGGHPDAKMGIENAPLVLPSWYNMNPDGKFIRSLYSKQIPDFIEHHLFYAFNNSSTLKLGENSDGVVPLSSQLHPLAQEQSIRQYGFNQTHTSILQDNEMISTIIQLIEEYKSFFPKSHMKYLIEGGYNVQLPGTYTKYEQYAIKYLGKYMSAMANGVIEPKDEYDAHFLAVLNGEEKPNLFTESAWLKFRLDFPELAEARGLKEGH